MKKTNPKALPAPQAYSGISEATPSEAKAEPAKADAAMMDPPRIRRWSEMTIGQLQAAVMRGGLSHSTKTAMQQEVAQRQAEDAEHAKAEEAPVEAKPEGDAPADQKPEAEKPEAVVIARDKAGKPAVTVEKVAAKAKERGRRVGPKVKAINGHDPKTKTKGLKRLAAKINTAIGA